MRDGIHQAALGKAGSDRRRHRPALLRLCALSELKNALRSGDVWVQGSRQFKDFDEYLLVEVRHFEAGQRIAAGSGHRLRPIPA
ncbi:hypothetical protein AB6E88_10700 [Providencia hangzhouensis]